MWVWPSFFGYTRPRLGLSVGDSSTEEGGGRDVVSCWRMVDIWGSISVTGVCGVGAVTSGMGSGVGSGVGAVMSVVGSGVGTVMSGVGSGIGAVMSVNGSGL